jgi:hypothetical protein
MAVTRNTIHAWVTEKVFNQERKTDTMKEAQMLPVII